jgi:GT2 family glycosyltransferase
LHQLSVIIVNYNVKYFLEQCLRSVFNASKNCKVEVFVVDNNSIDDSVELVKTKFPEVKLIENKINLGFSKANNQAIKMASGKYILLLNPDTVVGEDTFEKVITFMDSHSIAGGLGVKMLDGKGNFLPESKRGLPTPLVAFYKIFGLSKLFPKSTTFGKYHLGYLDKDKTHEVDVLSGAFMLLRKETLDKIGLLDEDFFMYGEDIDLSYRVIKGGYKNYYFSDTSIIHYKGESTKKSSVNYVFVFYNAMIIFAKKHFSQSNAQLFSFFINLAIYIRASMAISYRFLLKSFIPLIDFIILFTGLWLIKNYYEKHYVFKEGGGYSNQLVVGAFLAYVLVWQVFIFLSGGYDKPIKIYRILRGIIAGSASILIVYSLLPENYRFSRAMILIGSAWAMISFLISRLALHFSGIKAYNLKSKLSKRFAVVGSKEEYERVVMLIQQTNIDCESTVWLNTTNENSIKDLPIKLQEIVEVEKINEVVFCSKDLSSQTIMEQMLNLVNLKVDFKIAPPESLSIIGSNSINTAGDLYIIDTNSISKPENQRKKRVLDIGTSILILAVSPLLFFIQNKKIGFIKNCILVLIGNKTWVGYKNKSHAALPEIKKAVLSPSTIINPKNIDDKEKMKINLIYAKDYKPENDLLIIMKGLKNLGNQN